MVFGTWAALPAAAAPGQVGPTGPRSATLDGVGDTLFPMFGVGKPTITVEPQPETFPADSPPDLDGLQVDFSWEEGGEQFGVPCIVVAAQPGPGSCEADVFVNTDVTAMPDPASQLPPGFLTPAPVTFNFPDCDPGGEGPKPCPATPTITLPGTWRPVGLTVTNAATRDPVADVGYTLCAPGAAPSGGCPAGTGAVGSATSGADGALQFPGVFQGSPDYQVVPTAVSAAFVSPNPQPLAVPTVNTLADAGKPFFGKVALTPKAPTAADDTATVAEDNSVDIDVSKPRHDHGVSRAIRRLRP